MPTISKIQDLMNPEFWAEFFNIRAGKSRAFRRKAETYWDIVETGAIYQAVREVLDCTYRFQPPVRHILNKIGTSKKKVVYTYSPPDELLLKGVNIVLQDILETHISPVCHSFRKGRGAKSAFNSIFADRDIDSKFCLRLDIKNYFNSVDVKDFMSRLPNAVTDDEPLLFVLKSVLLDNRVIWGEEECIDNSKGLMAGSPLAPALSNIYLRELDEEFRCCDATYVRYSDDIIMFSEEIQFARYRDLILNFLEQCRLEVNVKKTSVLSPGEPWEYLGFRYERGIVDISAITMEKAKGKIRRLANKYNNFRKWKHADPVDAVGRFIRRINGKYFGVGMEDSDLCWAKWFFPVVNTTDSLRELDSFIQDKIRYVASGKYSRRSYKIMPYSLMRELAYLPLTAAYFVYRTDSERYYDLIDSRILRS